MQTPENVTDLPLFAWVGEDEFGSGQVGLKQAFGMIALVSKDREKIEQQYIVDSLQKQANAYGKTIRLCRFAFVEEVITIEPEKKS